MLKSYFEEPVNTLSLYEWVKTVDVLRYDIDSTDEKDILLYRLRVYLSDNSLIEMTERIVQSGHGSIMVTKYSFHWQNADGELNRRWDNAPHFRNIPTYPDHIHIGKEDNVHPSLHLSASEVLSVIDNNLNN